jgi:hypothetical protein
MFRPLRRIAGRTLMITIHRRRRSLPRGGIERAEANPPEPRVGAFPGLAFAAMLVGLIVWPYRSGCGEVRDIALSLQTDRTVYRVGQRVIMTLTVANRGDQPLRLTFPSAQVHDFSVRQGSREVWRWSLDKMFATVLTDVLLLREHPQSYTAAWEQIDTEGRSVPPGEYEVVGVLVNQLLGLSRSLRIVIQPRRRSR